MTKYAKADYEKYTKNAVKRKSVLLAMFFVLLELLIMSAILSGCEKKERGESNEKSGADWGLGLMIPSRVSSSENQIQPQDTAAARFMNWSDEMKTKWAKMFPDGKFSDIKLRVEEFVWIDEVRQLKGYEDQVFVHYVPFEYALAELPVLLQIEAPDLASGLDEWLHLTSENGTDLGWQPFLEQWLTEHDEHRKFLVEACLDEDKSGDHYGNLLLMSTMELCDAVNGGIPGYLQAFAADQNEKGSPELQEFLNNQDGSVSYAEAIGTAREMAGGGQETMRNERTGQDAAEDEQSRDELSFMSGKIYETFAESYTLSGTLSYRTFAWDWNPAEKEGIIFILDQPIQVAGYSDPIKEIQLIMDGDVAKAMDGSHLSVTGRLMESADTSDWILEMGMMVDSYQAD